MRTTRTVTVTRQRINPPVKEWRLQAAAVKALRRAKDAGWPIRIAGDMNAARRTLKEQGLAAATGMNPGEPDLRVYMPGGRLLLIEFKAKGGSVSEDQKKAHAELRGLGFEVVIVQPRTEQEAEELTLALVRARLPANDNKAKAVDAAA